ncbi:MULTISPECIES: hypothetical protein [unclassified Actinobaculum]|uniref:hypothetical protein n=1 Tax=unclassified Actinobaculum TaxID=2609299 RepID=UPI000F7398CE|nr:MULTISPECIES: hypothetical protein [unclassified Actinobaculum]RTE48038.1 hypothetical protein EKN07_11235 [Actinobaculum sp. 352]
MSPHLSRRPVHALVVVSVHALVVDPVRTLVDDAAHVFAVARFMITVTTAITNSPGHTPR